MKENEQDQTSQFIDLNFAPHDQDDVLRDVEGRAPLASFAYIVTPNVDHVVRLQHDRSDLWPMYRLAWLTLCDSRILGRLARRVGLRLPVVPGSDLTVAMFRRIIRPDDAITVIGGSPAMVESLRRLFGLTRLLHHNPPMGFIQDAAATQDAVDFAIAAQARYTFLAVGSPQQEILAYRIARTGRASGVGLCVGASLLFLTQAQRRAPAIVQRLGMEWLFRLLSDPLRLWRRYLVEGPLIFAILREWRLRQ
ncbi:exopolysaccharide biosynthesis WecB/TagA/CpsF family protein [Novosphingobium sp. SG751A]|uniref:WecB/TagA/CpsF family glycosyltransferase n=1 Tax=Novosphingobium sp. SG751A TaxID=2587000 RepID=UPI001557D14A|nr:WecB/TagA/CpsF family glycosyltransferase [Novosphingobium sp. SG751A]NOW46458.1 exopolysaccharide biosynthesis WecB/TagA/CpsF family protein [Novosphingobium sp. SG751A]